MIIGRRFFALATLAAALVVGGCSDGLIRPAAPAGPAHVALAASFSVTSGGVLEAYQKVDALSIRFLAGSTVRLAQVVPFDPGATQTEIELQVPLEDASETFDIELELRDGQLALFRGSGSAVLSAGGTNDVNIPIVPIVSGVTCAGTPVELRAYGAVRRLLGFGLFASGDTVPGTSISWSVAPAGVVRVDQTGDVTALQQDGTAQVTCSTGSFSGTRQVQVFARVARVQVSPARDTATVGASVTFTATLSDSLNNVITAARPLAWTSANPSIATVNANGLATALSLGVVAIRASSDAVRDSALLTVGAPPVARTIGGTPVGSGAQLQGGVNTQGLAGQAWFEWGTSPTLAGAQETPRQNLAAGTGEQALGASLANLSPGTTYYFRAAASNGLGTARGSILSFRSNAPPITVTQAAAVDGLSAALQGNVNPNGLAATAWFEWAANPAMTGAVQTTPQSLTAGTTGVPVSAAIANLTAGTTYYFRVAASNAVGTTRGDILSFTAGRAPTVATLPASSVTGSSVTLQASVNPNGAATSAWFEWAPGRFPTTFDSTPPQSLGAGTGTLNFASLLSNLQSGTTYSYRVAASNAAGTTRGSLVEFTTGVPPTVFTLAGYYYNFGAGTYSYMDGEILPNEFDTEVWFEYSTTSATLATYSSTAIEVIPVGGQVEVGYSFYGSAAGVVWFRAVARNPHGTSRGAILRAQPGG